MLINLILILLILLALFVVTWQTSNLVSVFFGCPYVSAGKEVIAKALQLAKIKKGDIFYDLGCGKGEVLVLAAGLGAKATGFEISPYYYLWSKSRAFFRRIWLKSVNKIRSSGKSGQILVRFKNIKSVDFSRADIVYCYLLPEFLEKLSPKLRSELKKGARVISISFQITGLKLVRKAKVKDKTIYIYSASSRAA